MVSKVIKMKTCFDASITRDGEPPLLWVARINHTSSAGLNIFTSDDVPGLCVAHRQVEVAVRQLPDVIRALVLLNKGFDCEVELGLFGQPGKVTDQPNAAAIRKVVAGG